MATDTIDPPIPEGFVLEEDHPPIPEGFVLEEDHPPIPDGFALETPKRADLEFQMLKERARTGRAELLRKGLEGAEAVTKQASNPADLLNVPARLAGQPDVIQPDKPLIPVPSPSGTGFWSGVGRVGANTINALQTPNILATLPAFAASGLLRGLTVAQLLLEVPAAAKKGIETLRDPQASTADKVEALANPAVSTAMATLLARHGMKRPSRVLPTEPPAIETGGKLAKPITLEPPIEAPPIPPGFVEEKPRTESEQPNAGSQQETAAVHGNVQPQPVEGQRQVSVEEGQPGIQPRPEQAAKEGEVLLKTPQVSKPYNRKAYQSAVDTLENPKATQDQRNAAEEQVAVLKKAFPNIHTETQAARTALAFTRKQQYLRRFQNETADTGDDILGWIRDQGGVLSPKGAERVKGKEWWQKNKAEFNGKQPMQAPQHGLIFSDTGQTPDELAQAAHDAGLLPKADSGALWDAIDKASRARAGKGKTATGEAAELKNQIAQHHDWIESIKKGGEKVPVGTLAVGDSMEVDGEHVKVTAIDPETGHVTVEDGRRFERQQLDPDSSVYVEKYNPSAEADDTGIYDDESPEFLPEEKPAPAPKVPKLAPGVKQGDLISSTQTEDFALAGERGTDADRLAAAKAKAERDAAEAKAIETKQQLELAPKPEPKTGLEAVEKSKRIKIKPPEGATFIRGTTASGKSAVEPVSSFSKGNPFQGAGITKIEAGTKDKTGRFNPMTGEPQIVEMGGDVYRSEVEPGEGDYVSNMFAVIDKSRAEMGKPPMPETKARTWDQDNTRALRQMRHDPGWIPGLIESLRVNPRPLLSWENAGMVWHRYKLTGEMDNALTRVARAYDDGREADVQSARLDAARFEDQIMELDDVVGRNGSGSEAGRSLQAQKMGAGDDFTLVEMRLQKRAANGGKPLTPEQESEVSRLHAELEAAKQRITAAEDAKRQAEIDKVLAEGRATEAAKPKFHPKILEAAKRIVGTLDTKADAARARIKERLARTSAGVDPTVILDLAEIGASHLGHAVLDFGEWSAKMVDEFGDYVKPHLQAVYAKANEILDKSTAASPEVKRAIRNASPEDKIKTVTENIITKVKAGKKQDITPMVQRLTRAVVESGVKGRDAVVDRVHDLLKRAMPEITKRETMEAISGYGDFRQLTKDQISVELRGIKGELQQILKLEDMAKGDPPLKSGVERRTPTEAERQLIKKVNEAKFAFQVPMDDPATQLKSALDTYKTSLKNRTTDLEARIAAGDFSKRTRRELQLDPQAMRLKADYERVKQKFRQSVLSDKLKQRPTWEKAMDALVSWRRGFILSGPVTLGKLTAAAIARTVITPTEEAIGSGLSKLPFVREISAAAPREGGGLNTKAEVKAITQGFTEGMKDAWETLKTGKSSLDVQHTKKVRPPQSFIDVFGNIHGALKAPVKRAEFARSFQKRADFLASKGVDVTDEFVQMKIGIEAYKDAEKSIFMQPNVINNAYKMALAALDRPEKSTGKPSISGRATSTAMRTLLPIVKVPTNIVGETMQYAIGSVTGSTRLANAFRKGIDTLKPEEADLIMRELKKGSLGGAAMLFGYFAPNVFGGFYQQGEKRKAGDIKPDAARVAGVNIPPAAIHNPLVNSAQIGATIERVADSKLRKKDKTTQGLSHGALAGAIGLADATPFIRESVEISKLMNPYERDQWIGTMQRSLLIPQGVQSIANYLDENASGQPVKRKPVGLGQNLEMGIPGLRQNVPAK